MRAVGIILAGGNSRKMRELTSKRAAAAMPIAGSYRAIDFTLSNMTNSHIQKVAVLTQYNARSLNEHLNSSKWWDFGRKQGGLFVFTPTITADNGYWYRGTADAIYQNLDFLKKCHEPYVIITSGDAVYKLDYNKVLEYHIAKKADITVVCKDLEPGEDATRFGTVRMNEESRIDFLTSGKCLCPLFRISVLSAACAASIQEETLSPIFCNIRISHFLKKIQYHPVLSIIFETMHNYLQVMKLPPLFLPRKRHIPFFQRTEKIIINIKENRCDRPGQRIAEYNGENVIFQRISGRIGTAIRIQTTRRTHTPSAVIIIGIQQSPTPRSAPE